MLRVLLFLVPLALAIYALVDCISSKNEEIKHLPRLVWLLLIVVAWVIGPLAWIFAGRERAFPWSGGGHRLGGGWVAPDDNPDFLRTLGEQRRQGPEDSEEEIRRRDASTDDNNPTDPPPAKD